MAGEYLRKSIHMLVLLPALLLRWVNDPWTHFDTAWILFMVWVSLLINYFLLGSVSGGIFRDLGKKRDWGIIIYPIAIFALVLLYADNIWIIGGAFAMQAIGDGVATMAGLRFGGPKLPWNRKKSYAGTVSFAIAGWIGTLLIIIWIEPDLPSHMLVFPCLITAVFCAITESLPISVNDNLTVPLLAGVMLSFFFQLQPDLFAPHLSMSVIIPAVCANLALAWICYGLSWVTRSGAVVGGLLGVSVYIGGGAALFSLLIVFVALGTAVTLFRKGYKRMLGTAHNTKGMRSARHALANCSVAAACALWFAGTGESLWMLAAVAALAAALGDTVASELGMVFAPRPFRITDLEIVKPGENGAVSMVGTLLGGIASLLLALLAWSLGLISFSGIALVIVVAQLATMLDSLLGATLEKRGILDNEGVNFCSTLLAAVLVYYWGPIILS
jgi:uncharacterized protein (TIGR00297 family)